jgi:hypothetical protein
MVLSSCALLALIFIFGGGWEEVQAKEQISEQTSQLRDLQALVAENEALSSLIKMSWSVQIDPGLTESQSDSMVEKSGHRGGPPYTHYLGIWAQDDIRQHVTTDFFSGPDKWERGGIKVVDGEVYIEADKPDFMSGGINYIDNFKTLDAPIMFLGLRPFNHKNRLSELLVPEYASINEKRETIDGHETYVVDVKKPGRPNSSARIWVDCERGAPLRVEFYKKSEGSDKGVLMCEINSVKLHRLPNGGWFPVAGNRVLHWRSSGPHPRTEHIAADVNSITIRREDIPDSLFTFEFPEGARVYNAITGTTTEGGWTSSLKLESTIDDSIRALNEEDSDLQAPTSEQLKAIVKSPQPPDSPPPNEPTRSAEPKTGQTYPTDKRGLSNLVWILLSAFMAALALTIIVLLFRRPQKKAEKR